MEDIFERELNRPTVFVDRNVLSPHYVPQHLPHREAEIEAIMRVLAPALRGKRIQNLFIYGKCGCGKTACTKHVINRLLDVKQKYGATVDCVYINCRNLNTKYQVMLKCAEYCYPNEIFLGYPYSVLLERTMAYVSQRGGTFIVVLDEVDKIKNLDDLIYSLTRANDELERGHISIIGITNSATFKKALDPRTRSTLCEEEIVFAPYNAIQLQAILRQRAELGFKKGAVDDGAIELAAALAAQESGDARYALKLLLKAGEMADAMGSDRITEEHVRAARKGVEVEIVHEIISTMPEHQKIVLYAIAQLTREGGKYARLNGNEDAVLFSGEVYERYRQLCQRYEKDARSARWCREYINELEMLGLITTTLSSKGVRGNTTLIRLAFPADEIEEVLLKSL